MTTERADDPRRANRVATVTLNPAIDQTLRIPDFRVGAVNRVQQMHVRAGGKGVNVAACLADAGAQVAVTGLLGADNAGLFEVLFARKRIADHFVRVAGSTRTGIKVVDAQKRTTDINLAGLPATADQLAQLRDRVAELAATHAWVVLAGSLPPGAPTDTWAGLIALCHEHGALTALDTSGPALAAALAASPTLAKPNEVELADLGFSVNLDEPTTIAAAGRELLASSTTRERELTLVVSLGHRGAVLISADGAWYAEPPPDLQVVSSVGAGDAMLAGLVAGSIRGLPPAERLQLATAFAASAVTRPDHDLASPSELDTFRFATHVRPL